MTDETNDRGFQIVSHPCYPTERNRDASPRLAQQSSAIGDYPDSFDRPGTSFLWLGDHHHLNREEVAALVERLSRWLDTGKLF